MNYCNTNQSRLRSIYGRPLHALTILLASLIASSGISLAQTKIDIDAFKARSQKKVEKLEGDEISNIVWTDPKGVILEKWLSPDGKVILRQSKAAYVFVVPGPGGHFLRKAWLTTNGDVIEEERRVYDSENRLTVEGYVDPVTGSFTLEYRHRYSPDGKTQFTTEFKDGKQVGKETATVLEE
jgi:hypothetical protein